MFIDLDKDDSLADDVFAVIERAKEEGQGATVAVLTALWCALHSGRTRELAGAVAPFSEGLLLNAAHNDVEVYR